VSHRAIVSVGVHHETYLRRLDRMTASLDAVGWPREDRVVFRDALPPGSPTHEQIHYGFKAYALEAAVARGFTTLLWVDAGPVFIRHPGPLFDHIEARGHWLFTGTEFLDRWSSDRALFHHGISRDEAEKIPFVGGSAYGVRLTDWQTVPAWLARYFEAVRNGTWAGPFVNLGPHWADARAGLGPRTEGLLSDDPRCWGHRQDETILSILAYLYGLAVEPGGDWGGRWIAADTPENRAREDIVIGTGNW
jgi:hypothetical protein